MILAHKFRKAAELRRKIRILRKGIEGLKSEDPYDYRNDIYKALEICNLDFVEECFSNKLNELKKELELL